MIFRKVIDIDFVTKYSRNIPTSKQEVLRTLRKFLSCKNFELFLFKWSSFKGCHIILFCDKDCDICRMCIDDDKHFNYDMARPEECRNISFDKKEKVILK